jgi:hypothetical protein
MDSDQPKQFSGVGRSLLSHAGRIPIKIERLSSERDQLLNHLKLWRYSQFDSRSPITWKSKVETDKI